MLTALVNSDQEISSVLHGSWLYDVASSSLRLRAGPRFLLIHEGGAQAGQ